MNTDWETEFYQKKLRRRLAIARILLILGWMAVMASLATSIGTIPGWHLKPFSIWAVVTSPPAVILFAPLFVGLMAGTVPSFLSRIAPRWIIGTCRIATVGLFCEIVPLCGVYSVYLVIYLLQQPSSESVAFGTNGLIFVIGGLLVGLSAWVQSAKKGGKNINCTTRSQPGRTCVSEAFCRARPVSLRDARRVLIIGWVLLLISMPMTMASFPASVQHPSQRVANRSTWAAIRWSVELPKPPLFIPYFGGLVAATLGAAIPLLGPRWIWLCRVGAAGVCSWLWATEVAFALILPALNVVLGIGFYVFCLGSLLIGLSAWIRPAGTGKSDNAPNSPASPPQAVPASGIGGG